MEEFLDIPQGILKAASEARLASSHEPELFTACDVSPHEPTLPSYVGAISKEELTKSRSIKYILLCKNVPHDVAR